MTKNELNNILQEDLARYSGNVPKLKDWFVCNESWYIFHLVKHVRYIEYHQGKSGWHKIANIYHRFLYKRLSLKLQISIYPGTIAGGVRIYHAGGPTRISPNCRIGRNCTIISGVIFGNKYEKTTNQITSVGDNCYFGADSKIIGNIKIGNNVTVGANAVVVKDIPDNSVVGGVPAKIIKQKLKI